MGCSFVGLTATLAAFWRRKPSDGPDLHPERSAGPQRSGGWRSPVVLLSDAKARRAGGKEPGAAIAGPGRLTADRPLEGRVAVSPARWKAAKRCRRRRHRQKNSFSAMQIGKAQV